MANLSSSRILELIKKPLKGEEIEQAKRHENKLKLHCQTIVDVSEFGEPQKAFLKWVACLLPPDIYTRFESLFQPPFPTLELTESIFNEISRIFEGQNKFFKFEFKNPDHVEDLSDYLIELEDESFWKNTAFEALQYALNSFVVVDLPAFQASKLPEPYYYLLDIDNVIDVGYSRKGDVDYILINEGRNTNGELKVLYIDSAVYQRIEGELFFPEVFHNLGYTPVKDFWKTRKNRKSIDKKGPITKSLGELNWLLFFEISKKYLDLYAPYPIYSGYTQKCGHVENGIKCENGTLAYEYGTGDCPKCKGKGKITVGVGSYIEVPPPIDGQDADLRNPVQVLPAEINSLNYCVGEIERLEEEIFHNCVGKGGEPNNEQAQNEKQIKGAFESKINVLEKIKTNFEIIHKWTLDTICTFRYGDSFINSTVNYGDVTYLETIDDLNNDYKEAKDSGKPIFELANKRDRIYNTENKNNSDELLRTKILQALEPWQSLSLEQIKVLGLDTQSPEKYTLKVNFDEYIRRFEREQTNILMFGSTQLAFSAKIDRIAEVLSSYVNEVLNPEGKITAPVNDLEAQAKANLKGSVGGVQAILAIQMQVGQGITPYRAGVAMIREIFGYSDDIAQQMLGPEGEIKAPQPINQLV